MNLISSRVNLCLEMLEKTLDIDGDIIEMGVYKGETTFQLSKYLLNNNSTKKVYACDTFTGIPEDDTMGIVKRGDFEYSLDDFTKDYKKLKLDNIITIDGNIDYTLEKYLNKNKFCFAWLDLDAYKSTLSGFKFINNHLSIGGIVGFHDYNFKHCLGVKKVVDENVDLKKYRKIKENNFCIFFKKLGE